jgi:N-acetylglucosamine kinase-like BadF-type ATPase
VQMLSTEYVLGVDGGGSWTRSVIMRPDGTIIGVGKAGPSNPITSGVEKSLKNIFLAEQKANQNRVYNYKLSIFGIAGVYRSKYRQLMFEKLSKAFGEVKIISDTHSALAGATGCKTGVIAIAGTGSIAYGVNEKGLEAKAGGWGWRLGDEGSGYTIGKNALKAVLRYYDDSEGFTSLKEMILNKLELTNVEEIVDWAYDPNREPRHFASLVPIVKEAEKQGDLIATQIMRESGAELGIITQTVIKKLKMSGKFPVACCGGVFKQPNGYNVSFEDTVKKVAPRCVFIEPLFSPTIGSALLALKSQNIEVNELLLSRVNESFGWYNE